MRNLEKGFLVRWVENKNAFGVVREITERYIDVRWDAPGAPPRFTKENPPIEHYEFTLGQRVEKRSSSQKGIVRGRGVDPLKWVVNMQDDGADHNIVAEDLRPVIETDPLSRMRRKEFGSVKDVLLALVTRDYRLQHFNNDLVSLAAAKVDLKPHQVSVVHRVVHSYPHRFLLCDEVGLGKTIEAGMIFKELEMRDQVKRALVIVPANLQKQWRFELKSKFNSSFHILNTRTAKDLDDQGYSNPFLHPDYRNVIVSERWISSDPWADMAAQVDWDILIIDEAHHARHHADGTITRLFRFVRDLVNKSRADERVDELAILMLTATPMQLHPVELFALVSLLDPDLFLNAPDIQTHQHKLPRLNQAVTKLRNGVPADFAGRHKLAGEVAGLLNVSAEKIDARFDRGAAEIELLCEQLADQHLLSDVMIRNRKANMEGFLGRKAHRWGVDLTGQEKEALMCVEDYVQQGYALADSMQDPQMRNRVNFVMVIFQKLMASSIYALRCSFERRRAKLRDAVAHSAPIEDDASDDDHLPMSGPENAGALSENEIDELTAIIDKLIPLEDTDSKAGVFLEKMAQIRREVEGAKASKVLVFTQSRDTQDFLQKRLHVHGWGVSLFHGQLTLEEKDGAVEEFRTATEPHVLISTEAGGEGRNFQFCNMLVNYDLPWNPMRVEQRIGRIDRIGQEKVVQIFNLWVTDSIEQRVLEILQHRINLFERTVGGLETILGDSTEEELRHILRLERKMREQKLLEWEARLEESVRNARRAEEQLQDLIMDTKSYSKAIAERAKKQSSPIDAEAQERFMKNLLKGMGVSLEPKKPHGTWQLFFKDPFLSDCEKFLLGSKCRAVLRPDMLLDLGGVQYFAFGHPVVEIAIKKVLAEEWSGNAGAYRLIAEDGLRAAQGWMFVWEVEIPDIREHRNIVPVFVEDGVGADIDFGWALVGRAARFSGEQFISPEEAQMDSLDQAYEDARRCFDGWSRNTLEESRSSLAEKIEKERQKIEKIFDHRDSIAEKAHAKAEASVKKARASADEGQQKILPALEGVLKKAASKLVRLKSQREERNEKLQRRETQGIADKLVGVYRVEIAPPNGAA